MADGNDNFMGLDRDQLRDIGLGIGAGFQSYDPNNPFAGAGAALSATLGSGIIREERKRERQNKIEDEARQEERALRMARQQREDAYNFYRDKRMQMIASGKKGAAGPRDGSAAMLQATEYGKALWNELSRFFTPVGKKPTPYRAPMSTETAEELDIVDPYRREIGDDFIPAAQPSGYIQDLLREAMISGKVDPEDLPSFLKRTIAEASSDMEEAMDVADPYRNEPKMQVGEFVGPPEDADVDAADPFRRQAIDDAIAKIVRTPEYLRGFSKKQEQKMERIIRKAIGR